MKKGALLKMSHNLKGNRNRKRIIKLQTKRERITRWALSGEMEKTKASKLVQKIGKQIEELYMSGKQAEAI